jgi:hypothetical protein
MKPSGQARASKAPKGRKRVSSDERRDIRPDDDAVRRSPFE